MQVIAQLGLAPQGDNAPVPWPIRGAGLASLAGYGLLVVLAAFAAPDDLGARPGAYLALHGALVALMLVAWAAGPGGRRTRRFVLVAALAFRVVASLGPPALSGDVYRYVWDGRVQLHGMHPYRLAPYDPALAELRDAGWSRINQPELKTIYPPVAQWLFALLAATHTGTWGFKLAMGLADFGVVLALARLLRRLSLPPGGLVLYAWNPLAVVETAGSGHLEPVGVALVLLAAGWAVGRRPLRSALALATAVHVKLLPVVAIPALLRRAGPRAAWPLAAALGLPVVLVAWGGPAVGGGVWAYAERWESNATIFAVVHRGLVAVDAGATAQAAVAALQRAVGDALPPSGWDWLYRHAWPSWIARGVVGLAAAGWIAWLARKRLDVVHELLLAFGGVLLLAPTLHPWYVLWVLPFAAARRSAGWLTFAALVPLVYLAGPGEVGWGLRLLEYGPALAAAVWARRYRTRGNASGGGSP